MSGKRLVCIDDDPFYRDLFRDILEPKGFEVITAADPGEGWKAITESHPDLVTLDIMMPEAEGVLDGYGLLEKMKGNPATKDIPAIMVSALGDGEDVKLGLESGARSYLPKHEMTPAGLVSMITDILAE